jgi:hypothetical protein
MTHPPASPVRPGLRVSDAERAAAMDRLSAHAAAGRLSMEELEERVAATYAAVSTGDLSAVEADLPDLTPQPRRETRSNGWAALPLMILALILVVLTILASVLVGHPVVLPLLALLLWRQLQRSGRVPTFRRTW